MGDLFVLKAVSAIPKVELKLLLLEEDLSSGRLTVEKELHQYKSDLNVLMPVGATHQIELESLKKLWIMNVVDWFKQELELSQSKSDLNVLIPVGSRPKTYFSDQRRFSYNALISINLYFFIYTFRNHCSFLNFLE